MFLRTIEELKPEFTASISEIMVELQKTGDSSAISSFVDNVQPPAVMAVALTESLLTLSRGDVIAQCRFFGMKNVNIEALNVPTAFFTYSFCRKAGRNGQLPASLTSSLFKFEKYTFAVKVTFDNDCEPTDTKYVGVSLQQKDALSEAAAVRVMATLRVVNLLNPGTQSFWTKSYPEATALWSGQLDWRFRCVAPQDSALQPTASGSMGCVQVVSIEIVNS